MLQPRLSAFRSPLLPLLRCFNAGCHAESGCFKVQYEFIASSTDFRSLYAVPSYTTCTFRSPSSYAHPQLDVNFVHAMIVPPSYSRLASSIAIILIAAFHSMVVHAFTFSNTKPAECDDLTVSWSGTRIFFEILCTKQLIFDHRRPATVPFGYFIGGSSVFTSYIYLTLDHPATAEVAEHLDTIFCVSRQCGVLHNTTHSG